MNLRSFFCFIGIFYLSTNCLGSLVTVSCNSLICGDIVADCVVDDFDYESALGILGERTTYDKSCVEGPLSKNGYQDMNDQNSWDWKMDENSTLCSFDLFQPFMSGTQDASTGTYSICAGAGYGNSLLITGNLRDINGNFSMNEGSLIYDDTGTYVGNPFSLVADKSNGRLFCDISGNIYQLNTAIGLTNLNTGTSIVTPGRFSITSDPRYSAQAIVAIGIQKNTTASGTQYGGRAIMDAAIDADGYIYVVPVVVIPSSDSSLTYLAAAKLQLNSGQTPCYSIVRLYDDPPLQGDEHDPYREGLGEIEVDNSGNVYVTDSYYDSEADITSNYLWVYPANNGSPTKINLDTISGVTDGIPNPSGLFASKKNSMLYLTSGVNSPEATSVNVYGLSTVNLALSLSRTVQITNMGHISGMTEDPISGAVWVAGFKMVDIPSTPDTSEPPFYHACLVSIPTASNNAVQATCLDSTSRLAMPYSIAWIPSRLVSSVPVDQHYLWRSQKNICRLTFDGDITTPASGNIMIQQMLDGGLYGSDLSSNFTFTVENDTSGNPRILRIYESTQCLPNCCWLAIRNTGSWTGVANFSVEYPIQKGDANDDGDVTQADQDYVTTGIPNFNCADNDRRDVNGDGKILVSDHSVLHMYYPSTAVVKPTGH